ncbi:MAG TPA: DUF1573 domain-containing protein [Prolixibacteraceae bacterium]|nr:DUF1573 domain-containing protein [Prolixibacteraceae bacterium]
MLDFQPLWAKFNNFRLIFLGGTILIAGLLVFYTTSRGKEYVPLDLVQNIVIDTPVKIDYRHPYKVDYQPSESEDPQMVIEEQWFDLGKVSEGEGRRVSFMIENEGNSDLIIEGASSTCSCLAAELSSVIIPPGKSSQVVVNYLLSDTEQQSQIIRRGLIFLTNDPQFPQVEVWIQAKLKKAGKYGYFQFR